MELDPDAKPKQQPTEGQTDTPPAAGAEWGVGGKEEEGRFAPGRHGGEKPDEKAGPEKAPPPDALPPPGQGLVDTVIGFGDIRDVQNDSNVTSTTLVSLLFGFKYRFGKTLAFGIRMPVTSGSVSGPGGAEDDHKATGVGNFEISGKPSFQISNRLHLPVGLALDIPVASGDAFPEKNNLGAIPQWNINYAAAASRGFEEMALFASKRFALIPSIGLQYDRQAIHYTVSTKLEAMFKAAGGDAVAPGTFHDPNTNWVTGMSFFYGFLDNKISPGLRTWLAVATLPLSAGASEYSGVKWVAEPDVVATLPLNAKGSVAVQGGVGYILPIAGSLGGSATTSGLRADAALLF